MNGPLPNPRLFARPNLGVGNFNGQNFNGQNFGPQNFGQQNPFLNALNAVVPIYPGFY